MKVSLLRTDFSAEKATQPTLLHPSGKVYNRFKLHETKSIRERFFLLKVRDNQFSLVIRLIDWNRAIIFSIFLKYSLVIYF